MFINQIITFETISEFEIDKEASSLKDVSINDFDEDMEKIFRLSENQLTKSLKHLLAIKYFIWRK